MKLKVKFKALRNHESKVVNKTVTVVCPDFVERKWSNTLLVNGVMRTLSGTTSVDTQCMDWLDEQSKLKDQLMDKHDWYMILDYSVTVVAEEKKKKVSKDEELEVTLRGLFADKDPGLLADFMAVYKEMYESIKSMSVEKQVDLVLKAMTVGYKSVASAFKQLRDGKKEETTMLGSGKGTELVTK